jgi:hypothetical protein
MIIPFRYLLKKIKPRTTELKELDSISRAMRTISDRMTDIILTLKNRISGK